MPNPNGAYGKYKEEYNEQVYKLCLLGATDEEIANFFDVSKQTINNWKKAYLEFFDSIKRGKIKADTEVAESLFKRAKGYRYKETTISDDGIKTVEKEVAPDTTACMAWLKNRRRKSDQNWNASDKHELSGELKMPNIIISK